MESGHYVNVLFGSQRTIYQEPHIVKPKHTKISRSTIHFVHTTFDVKISFFNAPIIFEICAKWVQYRQKGDFATSPSLATLIVNTAL